MDFPMENSEASTNKNTSESHGTSVIFFAVYFFWSLQGDSPQSIESGAPPGLRCCKTRARLSGVPGPILYPQISKPWLHQGGGVRH